MPATAGSPALAGAEPGTPFLVTRLREAGAVILGKANLSEWANFRSTRSTSGWSTLGGRRSTRTRSTATRRAPAPAPRWPSPRPGPAVGRHRDRRQIVCPASACGIVGLKPTLGLVSRAGIVPISPAQDTAGPITRSVADAAALLVRLAGADPA